MLPQKKNEFKKPISGTTVNTFQCPLPLLHWQSLIHTYLWVQMTPKPSSSDQDGGETHSILPTTYSPIPWWSIQNECKKTLKTGERRQRGCGHRDLRNHMAVNSLGFLFASHIPDWVLKKLATQKQQMDKRKNKMPTKKKQTKKHAQKKTQPTKQNRFL